MTIDLVKRLDRSSINYRTLASILSRFMVNLITPHRILFQLRNTLKICLDLDPFMHQSIPNAPCTPPGNCGAFARLVSPGGGVFANLVRPGGRAFANPGDNPEKFVDVFKGMFS